MQMTSHDFQVSLVAFQRAQQVSAERQRTVVEGVKLAVDEEHQPESCVALPRFDSKLTGSRKVTRRARVVTGAETGPNISTVGRIIELAYET